MNKALSLLLFCLFGSVQAQIIEPNKELLWEISLNGKGPKSYLFGTIHSNDKRVFAFSDSLYVALNNSESIVLETDIFKLFEKLDTRRTIPSTLYDKNGQPYTGSNEASNTFYGSENGMPQFLDAYFETYCYNAKKSFYELESLVNQMELVSDFPIAERDAVNLSLLDFAQEKLMDLYLKGDLDALNRFVEANLSVKENAYENLIVKRNFKMSLKLDSLLKTKKSLFCAVGSGHLAGSDGLIRLLRSKGYRLRPILWIISENPVKAKSDVKSKNEFLYYNEQVGLVAKFPGKPFEKINEDKSFTLKYSDLGQGNTYQIDIQPMDSSLTLEEIASIYIASPPNSPYERKMLDNGTEIYEGLSDTYPEGLNWVRVMFGENYFAVIKTYGGNKFMHSDRPRSFFNKVWFE
ncbi:MAG: TraB/GumN family protein [Bacteroidota bacterium]